MGIFIWLEYTGQFSLKQTTDAEQNNKVNW